MGNNVPSKLKRNKSIEKDQDKLEVKFALENYDGINTYNNTGAKYRSVCSSGTANTANTTKSENIHKTLSKPFDDTELQLGLEIIIPGIQQKALALASYMCNNPEYLKLEKGEVLKILQEQKNQFSAQSIKTRKIGLVDKNYVICPKQSYLICDWYFHHMTRKEAENCLLKANTIGYFLVRPSQSSGVEFSWSILKRNFAVRSYVIKHEYLLSNPMLTQYYFHSSRRFLSLEELVAYYSQNCEFFKVPMLKPIPLEYTYDFSIDLTMPEELSQVIAEFGGDQITLSIRHQVGSGNFGTVHKAYLVNGKPVAVKFIKRGPREQKLSFIHEAHMLKRLHHPKILGIGSFCVKHGFQSMMITELMENGSLFDWLNSSDGRLLTDYHLLYISYQISIGGSYLEESGVIHRDLAARNILVGEGYRNVKISDFGLSYFSTENQEMLDMEKTNDYYNDSDIFKSSFKVPTRWTAPEAINYMKFSSKSDVWSFGVLLFELFSYGSVPYKDMTTDEVVRGINTGYRLPKPMNCPSSIYNLMTSCWMRHPQERPNFKTITERVYSIGSTLGSNKTSLET